MKRAIVKRAALKPKRSCFAMALLVLRLYPKEGIEHGRSQEGAQQKCKYDSK